MACQVESFLIYDTSCCRETTRDSIWEFETLKILQSRDPKSYDTETRDPRFNQEFCSERPCLQYTVVLHRRHIFCALLHTPVALIHALWHAPLSPPYSKLHACVIFRLIKVKAHEKLDFFVQEIYPTA
jgi:hypothetical protein